MGASTTPTCCWCCFAFGRTGAGLPEDINCDQVVDDADLLIVLFSFGSGC
jgi:hypothetical protein